MDDQTFLKSFKTRILTGLFVTFPLVLTILAIDWLFRLFDGILGGFIEHIFGVHIPGLGFTLSVLGVFAVGVFATTVLGRKSIDWTEKMLMRLPIFKSFYSTFKQLGDAFSPHNRAAFKDFVIVEYPRKGAHSFGFLTKECTIRDDDGEDKCYSAVYIPTNHLYLGDIALFRKEEVMKTELSIEEGVRVVLSAGIAAPSVIVKSKDYASMSAPPAAHPQAEPKPLPEMPGLGGDPR